MNILLISPNTLTVPYPVYPIGLDYVAGAIPPGHQVRIADMNLMDKETLAQLVDQFAPDIIGISCRNIDNTDAGDPLFFLDNTRQLVDWLRKLSKAVIVCGGSGFTIMPAQVLRILGTDYGIIGEGERFGLLVSALAQGLDPAGIKGVMAPGDKPLMPPPWPGPQLRDFEKHQDHLHFYLAHGGMLNLQSKRGCSFQCIYCPYPRIEGRKHRLIDPAAVAATALQLQEAGARYLFLTDSAFNSDVDHSLRVASALKTAGLTIPWGAFFAPIRLPDHYFHAMAEAGCQHVEFGTESLSAPMLRAYRKPFDRQDVLKAHGQARSAGLHVAHYFLFGGPGESAATINETLDTLDQLEKAVFFFFIGIRIYPGTPLYEMALAEGKIEPLQDMLQPVFYQPDTIDRPAIEALVRQRSQGRRNWISGSGGAGTAEIVETLHQRGFVGPLWEYLIR